MKSKNDNLWNEINVEDLEIRDEFGKCFWNCIDCFCIDCIELHCFCWDCIF